MDIEDAPVMPDFHDLLMAFPKWCIVKLAKDLGVAAEINPRDRKAAIVGHLSQVLIAENVLDWAQQEGHKVTLS